MADVVQSASAENQDADVARIVTLQPDPSILNAIGRGHTLASAVADIIDNSIDAGAEKISVRFMVRRGYVVGLRIRDDGHGMSIEQLHDAMTLGKQRSYDDEALGHFGIGLKASSLSQARVLSVYSDCGFGPVSSMRMHRRSSALAFSAEVLTLEASRQGFEVDGRVDLLSTGTVVEWRELDSVSSSGIEAERRAWLDGTITALRGELGMVFHRLISNKQIRIEIDEFDVDFRESGPPRAVDPIDPFAFQHSGKTGYPVSIQAATASGALLHATCHVLPPNSQSPSVRLLGKHRSEWQGFYFYRNGRLLQAGGWHSMTRSSGDLQLARVSLELTPELLGDVSMNPEKRGVLLKPELVRTIEAAVDATGDFTFGRFLADARETLKISNKREAKIKSVVPFSEGLPESVVAVIEEDMGYRPDARAAAIKWRNLEEGRLFRFDTAARVLWLNAGYRKHLVGEAHEAESGAALLKTALMFLLEGFFAKEHLRQTTLDQIEAWQRALAAAMGQQFDLADYEPVPEEEMLDFDGWQQDRGDIDSEPEAVGEGAVEIGEAVEPRIPKPSELVRLTRPPQPPGVVGDRGLAQGTQDVNGREESFAETNGADGLERGSDLSGRNVRPRADNALGLSGTDHDEDSGVLGDAARVTEDPVKDYFKKAGEAELLNAAEEVELAMRVEAGLFAEERLAKAVELAPSLKRELQWVAKDGHRARTHLLSANLRLVISIAKRYTGRGLEILDLIQEGNLGLLRAIDKFDYTKGFKFSTYATWWIRQGITRAMADLARTIRIPVHMVEQINQLQKTRRNLIEVAPEEPSARELAAETGFTLDDVKRMLSYDVPPLSLELIVGVESYAQFTFAVELGGVLVETDEYDSVGVRIESEEMSAQIEMLLDSLSEREAGVIRMRYGLEGGVPLTLDAIGDRYQLTRERIRQIEVKTMAKLRHPSRSQSLEIYARGYVTPSPKKIQERDDRASERAEERRKFEEWRDSHEAEHWRHVSVNAVGDGSAYEPTGVSISEEPVWASVSKDSSAENLAEPAVSFEMRIVNAYRQGETLGAIAAEEERDTREVAMELALLLLGVEAAADDESLAPRHGLAYAPDERARLLVAYKSGQSVERIAHDLQRTPLAVAWQLLDSPKRPVMVTRRILRRLRSENVLE